VCFEEWPVVKARTTPTRRPTPKMPQAWDTDVRHRWTSSTTVCRLEGLTGAGAGAGGGAWVVATVAGVCAAGGGGDAGRRRRS
jgi:hypothetical protein